MPMASYWNISGVYTVTIDLDYDTDWQTLRISDKVGNAYQHNSYAECNGHRFTE